VPRIPYLASDLAEPAALVDAVRARRGGMLYNLDRILLYSPPFADGWNVFMGKVRNELSVAPLLRELAICVVAIINRADYEFVHHVPVLRAAGATEAQIAALPSLSGSSPELSSFDPLERAIIAFTCELTRDAAVSDATFDAAAALLPNRQQLVELAGVIGAYNMVSRILVTFGIEPE